MSSPDNRPDMPLPEQVHSLLLGRRTIHDFKPERVADEIIDQALATAVWAPNHRMTEPWRFYRLGPETIDAVARLNADIVTASKGEEKGQAKLARWSAMPGWLVVTRMRSGDAVQSREDDASCAIAVHNLSLYLWSLGIGIKWVTGDVIRDARFCDLIWVDPAVEEPVAIVWYGYPADIPSARRTPADRFVVDLP